MSRLILSITKTCLVKPTLQLAPCRCLSGPGVRRALDSAPRPSDGRVECRRHAGHSKWQNIRHIKAAKDAQKSKTADVITKRIKNILMEGGSFDPKLNSKLARILEEGKLKGVPASTMNGVVKRMAEKKTSGQKLVYEMRGAGNCWLMVEAYTDRARHTKDQLRNIAKKCGGSVGDSGFASHSFQQKGVVYVPEVQERGRLDEDSALELAIDAGAEEVQPALDDNHTPAFQFICDPRDLHKVKNAVDARNTTTTDCRLEYIPHLLVTLTQEDLDKASKMIDLIEDVEDVSKVFSNIEAKGES